eukprot:COSAG01_NODE_40013_length_468_cov_36.281843_1_plen_48_part_10
MKFTTGKYLRIAFLLCRQFPVWVCVGTASRIAWPDLAAWLFFDCMADL